MKIADYKFTYLLIALLLLVLTPLLVGSPEQRSLLFSGAYFVVILFGILAVLRHRKALILVAVLVMAAIVAQITSFIYGAHHYPQLRLAVFAAILSLLAVLILGDVLRAEKVTWDKIQGAICVYMLMGAAWGLLYTWVASVDANAFRGALDVSVQNPDQPMIYFSFVTLTTLGYGDIVPLSHTARTLAWLEAVFGQIYLVVLVARLVGLQLNQSSDR